MPFEVPWGEKGLEGRSEEELAADRERFEALLEYLPIERVREEVRGFLTGQLATRFAEACGSPEAILDQVEAMSPKEVAEVNQQIQNFFREEAEHSSVAEAELQTESEHARHELVRHVLDMASCALRLAAPPATRVSVDRALSPAREEPFMASFQEWSDQRKESIDELRASLALSGDAIRALLEEFANALVERARSGAVTLPSDVELAFEGEQAVLRQRASTSQVPSSTQPQLSGHANGKRRRSAVAARSPRAAKG